MWSDVLPRASHAAANRPRDTRKMTAGASGFNADLSRQVMAMSDTLAKSVSMAQLRETMHKVAASYQMNPRTQKAMQALAETARMQSTAFAAEGVGERLAPALESYAKTLRLAQSDQFQRLQQLAKDVATGQEFVAALRTRVSPDAVEVLQEVDLFVGARAMETSVEYEQVDALATVIVEVAREHAIPDAISGPQVGEEDEDVDSSVQRTAVYLFMYLLASGVFGVTVAVPAAGPPLALLIALLAGVPHRRQEDQR